MDGGIKTYNRYICMGKDKSKLAVPYKTDTTRVTFPPTVVCFLILSIQTCLCQCKKTPFGILKFDKTSQQRVSGKSTDF